MKWQGWLSSKTVIIKIKFSIFNDILFISTEKIKLECEFLYSKYEKLSNSQSSGKNLKQGINSDTYHKHFIKKSAFQQEFH